MSTITKTDDVSVLSHQALTHPGSFVGSSIAVGDDLACTIHLYHANIEATANATGVSYALQTTPEASGNESWSTIVPFVTTTTAAVSEPPSGSEAASQTDIAVASTTGFSVGNIIYFQDAGTLADSEWGEVENVVSNTSIDLVDGITNAKDTADFIWTEAELYVIQLDLTAVSRLRIRVVHRAATGSNIHFKAIMTRADSIG